MKSDLTIEELANGYNQGSLSPSDLAVAEWKLANDTSFAEAVEMDALVNEVVVGNALANVRDQMASDLSNIEQVRKTKIKLGVTLGLLLVGLGLVVTFWNSEEKTTQANQTNNETTKPLIQATTNSITKPIKPTIEAETVTPIATPQKTKTTVTVKESVDKIKPQNIEDTVNIVQDSKPVSTNKKAIAAVQKNKPIIEVNNHKELICNMKFDYKSRPSCYGKDDGTIQVLLSTVSNAEQPFLFSIEELGLKSTGGSFYELKAGEHIVTLQDSKGCTSQRSVIIKEKDCLPESISFNPNYGEVAVLNPNNNDNTHLQVFSRAGVLIFENNFEPEVKITWNGKSIDGNVVNAGTYVGILINSKGEKSTIQLSVIK